MQTTTGGGGWRVALVHCSCLRRDPSPAVAFGPWDVHLRGPFPDRGT